MNLTKHNFLILAIKKGALAPFLEIWFYPIKIALLFVCKNG